MDLWIFMITKAVAMLLMAVQGAMLVRAILSWFPIDNRFVDFIYFVTEPFVAPFRMLFEKLGWFQGLPVDISFVVSYLVITVVLIFMGF